VSGHIDLERLAGTLGQPAMSRVVQRIHKRLAKGGRAEGRIVLTDPEDDERIALSRLLGKRFPEGKRISIDLGALDEMVRHAVIAESLAEAVTHLAGPLVDPVAVREHEAAAWRAMLDAARERDPRPEIGGWIDQLAKSGLLRRLSTDLDHARILMDQVLSMAGRFPAKGLLVKELAAVVTGDAHALDDGNPLTTLVLDLARFFAATDRPSDARARRDLWLAIGLIPDQLSATVLVHGLEAEEDTLTGRILTGMADAREPCRLTTRQLRRETPRFTGADKVFVCENPAVVQAAAERLERLRGPLICLDGRPNTAVNLLLAMLRDQGSALCYHGDFDWPGIDIANRVIADGATPWRMTEYDYREARPGPLLIGEPVTPSWSPDLFRAMRDRGYAVHEESVLDVLLRDLAT